MKTKARSGTRNPSFVSGARPRMPRRAPLAQLIALALGAGVSVSAAAQVKITPTNRTATNVTTSGAVTDVRTATVRGANAFNSFAEFEVGAAHTANLHLPSNTQNLVNLVDSQARIDGRLNSLYASGKIGGNVFFATPQGFVVGPSGVVNVGKLVVATPTAAFMEQMLDAGGNIDDASVARLMAGEAPLQGSGLIRIEGAVNALDGVELRANSVGVASGAKIIAGQAAAAAIAVNVGGAAASGLVTDAAGTIRIVADAAQVAGSLVADRDLHESGGGIYITAGSTIDIDAGAEIKSIAAAGNAKGAADVHIAASHATENGSGDAAVSVNVGGTVQGGAVRITASASDKQGSGQARASAAVTVSGAVTGTSIVVDAKADAASNYKDGLVDMAARAGSGALTGVTLGEVAAHADASVTIASGARLEAGTVDLNAAATRVAATPAVNIATRAVGAAAVLGELSGETRVTVASGAAIEAETLKVDARSDNQVDVSAYTITDTRDSYFAGTLAYSSVDVATKAGIAAGAAITAGDISLRSRNDNSFSTSATAMANGDGVAGAAAAIAEIDVQTTATFGADLVGAQKTGNLTIAAENNTSKNKASSAATTGSGAVVRIAGGAAASAGNYIQSKTGAAADKVGGKVDGNAQDPGSAVKVASAVTVSDVTLGASAAIADNARIEASGNVAVLARVEDAGVRNNANSEINAEVKKGDGKVAVSAGIAVGEFRHVAQATIGDNVSIDAARIGVGAEASQPITISWNHWDGFDSILPKLNANLGLLNEVLTSYASASGSSSGVGLFGSVNYFDSFNDTRAWVGKGANLHARGDRTDWKTAYGNDKEWVWTETVDLQARSLNESIDIAGNLSFLSPVSGTTGGAGSVSVGGGFNWVRHGARTIAGIGDGAAIAASGLAVKAHADDRLIAVSPTSGAGGGFGGNGIVALSQVDNATHASISNEALITADAVTLDAGQGLSVWSGAGSLSREESAAVGIAVAVNDIQTDTKASIGDNDDDAGDGSGDGPAGSIQADSLAVNATTEGKAGSFAVAGAMASSSDPDAKPGLVDRTKTAVSGKVDGLRNKAADKMADLPLLNKLADKVRAAEKAGADNAQQTKPSFGLAVSGAASVNLSRLQTIAEIDGAVIGQHSAGQADLLVRAVTDADLISGAGGAALAAAKNPSSKFSAGVSGAVAFNQLDNDTVAGIRDTAVRDAGAVKVQALSAGDQIAIGLGIAANTSGAQKPSAAVAGSVSLSLTGNDTRAEIAGGSIEGKADGSAAVEVTAYDRARIANGGGSLAYGGRAGAGAAVSLAQVGNSVEARVSGARLTSLDSLDVSALSAARVLNSAAMGAFGAESNSLSGSFVFTDVAKTVRAAIGDGAQVEAGGAVTVLASGVAGQDRLDALLHPARDNDVSFSLDRGAAQAPDQEQIVGDTRIGEDRGGEAIIGVAGQVAIGKNNLGLSFVGQDVRNTYEASIASATVDAGGKVTVEARDSAQIIAAAVGVGGATGKFSGMGSAVANVTLNSVEARIGSKDGSGAATVVNGAGIEVTARNGAEIYAGAGNLAFSKNAAAGAAVAYNQTANSTSATASHATLDAAGHAVTLDAASDSAIRALAVSGVGAQDVAVGGSLNINLITDSIQAGLDHVQAAAGSLAVTARDRDDATGSKSSIWSLAGNVSGAGKVAVGGAVSTNTIANEIDAAVLESDLTLTGDAEVAASAGSEIYAIAVAGGGAGQVAVNGSLAVNTLANTTSARIDGGSVAAGGLSVTASERDAGGNQGSRIWALAGAVSGAGTTAVAGGSAVNTIANDLAATVTDAAIDVGGGKVGIQVRAGSEIRSAAAAGGGAGTAAVTGALAVNTIANAARASLDNASLNAARLDVLAHDLRADGGAGSLIQSLAGNVNGAGQVSVGLASAVNTISNSVEAGIAGGTLAVSDATTVEALEKAKIETLAADGGGAGQVAAGGSATVNNIANTTRAGIHGSSNSAAGNRTAITASDESGIDSIAGAIRIGGQGGVGAAAAINRIGNTVDAYFTGARAGQDYQAKNVVLDAGSEAAIRTIAVGVAGGGQAGVAGSVATNMLDTTVTARIADGARVRAGNNVGVLAHNQDRIEVAAGAAGIGGANAGVALSTVANVIESQTRAFIAGAATQVTALGQDAADTLAIRTGELTAAPDIGAVPSADSFAWFALQGKTGAASGVAVNAFSTQQVGSIAASVGATLPNPKGSGAIGATAAVNVLAGVTEAYVDGAAINPDNTGAGSGQDVDIRAASHSYSTSFVAGASVSGDVAMGGALDTTTISRTTRAWAGDAAIAAADDVNVAAHSGQGIRAIGASAGGAIAGGAGTGIVGVIESTTEAWIEDSILRAADLDIIAASRSGLNLMGGTLAIGGGAVGGALAVAVSDATTRAGMRNGSAALGGSLDVEADADTRFWNAAVSGAAGAIGVAGMAAVNVVSNTTEATLDGAAIGSAGAAAEGVRVRATDAVEVRSYGGAAGAGIGPGLGLGAAANVTVAQSRVAAEVKDSAIHAAGALDVLAQSSLDAEHVTASAGLSVGAGLSGAASLILLGNGSSGAAMQELDQGNDGILSKAGGMLSGDKVSETDGLDGNQRDALASADLEAGRTDLAQLDAGRAARLGQSRTTLSGGTGGELEALNQHGRHDLQAHFGAGADADVTRAAVTGGSISAGAVSISATDSSRTANVAGAAGVGFGSLGGGGGVAITRVYNDVQAVLAPGALDAGNIAVAALARNGSGDAAGATAYAGGAGPVGLGAAWADAYVANTVSASIGGAVDSDGAVSVSASDTTSARAESIGAALGAGAVGVSVAMAEKNSAIGAGAGGTLANAATLNVTASSAGQVAARALAAAGGLAFAGTGAGADAFDRSEVRAVLADNADLRVTGAVSVTASATPQASAEALGVAAGGGASIGASVARAHADASIEAAVGNGVSLDAASLEVLAQSLVPDGGRSAAAKAVGGSAGYLFGGNASVADAASANRVESLVHSGASLAVAGAVQVAAANQSKQEAEALGIAAGIVAVGANVASAGSDALTDAHLDGRLVREAQSVKISAIGDDDNFAKAVAGSGGVVAGHAAVATTANDSRTVAELQRAGTAATGVVRAGAIAVESSHTARFNAEVDSVNASLLGASAAVASHRVASDTDALIGAGARIEGQDIQVRATDTLRKDWLPDYNVRAAAGGIASGAAAAATVSASQSTDAAVGANASLSVIGSRDAGLGLAISAFNDFVLRDRVKLDTGGVIAVALANNRIDVSDSKARVGIGSGAILDSVGTINLYARTHGRVEAQANAKTYGLAGAAQGDSQALVSAAQEIRVGADASLRADGEIRLGAGRDPDGTANDIYATALTDTWNKSAFPITVLSATGRVDESATIELAAGSKLRGVTDITLLAEPGQIGGTGRYTGMDLYRKAAQEAANAIGSLVGAGESSWELAGGTSSTNGASGVKADGLVESGIQNEQYLTIGWNKDTQDHFIELVSDEGITYTVTEETLAQSFQQRLNQLFSLRDEHAGNSEAVTAYNLEIARIEQQLRDLTGSGGKDFASRDVRVKFIDVAPILAAAGNIRIEGGSLTGSGSLVSPGDAKIEVINKTPYFLRLDDLIIPDQAGGFIRFNGSVVTDNASINRLNPGGGANFASVVTGANSPAPSILVKNTFDPSSAGSGAPAGSVAPDIYLNGDIRNLQGTATVQAVAGSVVADGTINAKTINLSAGRDFVLGYTEGFRHLGGSPEGLWADITRKLETGEYRLIGNEVWSGASVAGVWIPIAKVADRSSRSSNGSMVAGNNVYISGRYLNINGTIQSGLPDWKLDIGNLDAKIAAAEAAYARRVAAGNADPYVELVNWSQGNDPNATRKVTAWWNAQENRIELDGIRVEGGYMELFGQIISTGGGELKVLDGYGTIQINNTSGRDLVLRDLDVGRGVEGTIKITDLGKRLADNTPLTTVYKRIGSDITVWDNLTVDEFGNPTHLAQTYGNTRTLSAAQGYQPGAGQRYYWVTGESFTDYDKFHFEKSNKTFFDLFPLDWLIPASYETTNPTWSWSNDNKSLAEGQYLKNAGSQYDGYDFSSFSKDTSAWEYGDWVKWDRCTEKFIWCVERTYYAEQTRWKGRKTFYTHSVDADHGVAIRFIGADNGLIQVDSNGGVLLGGRIFNPDGSTSLSGSRIERLTGDAAIIGKDLTLTATQGIGTQAMAGAQAGIVMDISGTLTATSTAGDIRLADTGGDLRIGKVATGGGDVHLSAQDNLVMANGASLIAGRTITLAATNGSIGGAGAPVRIDSAAGTAGLLTASAGGDIHIREIDGDLRLDTVHGGGDVHLESASGRITDGNRNDARDTRAESQLLALWDDMDLMGPEAALAAEKGVQAFEDGKTQEYQRYWNLRKVRQDGSGNWVADDYDPGYRFAYSASERDLLKQQNGLSDADLGRMEQDRTAEYHRLHAEFGAAAYAADYRYSASAAERADLTQDAAWTDKQLKYAVSKGAFGGAPDTETRIETANVKGRNVTLAASQGGIGSTLADDVVIDLSNGISGLTDAQRIALASAERDDVSFEGPDGRIIRIVQRDDVDVETGAGGSITAFAKSEIYLGGEKDINVNNISSPVVRLKAGQGIADIQSGAPAISGTDVILEAANGSLGSAANPLDIAISGKLTARAGQDIHLDQHGGDLTIESLQARGMAALDVLGGSLRQLHADGIALDAGSLELAAGGDIGEAGNALRVRHGLDGMLRLDAGGSAFVASPGGALKLGESAVGQALQADAAGNLVIAGNVQSGGDAAYAAIGGLTLADGVQVASSQGGILITAASVGMGSGAEAQAEGAVEIEASGDVALASVVSRQAAGTAIRIDAGGRIDGDGGGDLEGAGIALTAGLGIGSPAGALEIRADRLEASAAAGDIDLDLLADTQAGAIIADGGAIRARARGALGFTTIRAGGDVSLDVAGRLDGDTLTANGSILIDAGSDASYATLNAGPLLTVNVAGHLQGGQADVIGNALVQAGSAALTRLEAGGSITAATVDALSIGTAVAGSTLDLRAGTDTGVGSAISQGDQFLHAGGLLRADSLDSRAGAIAIGSLAARTGSVDIGTAQAGTTLRVATSGEQSIGMAESDGAMTLDAGGAVRAGKLEGATLALRAASLELEAGRIAGEAQLRTSGSQRIGVLETGGNMLLDAAGAAGDIAFGRLQAGAPDSVAPGEQRLAAPSIAVDAGGSLLRREAGSGDAHAEGMLNMKAGNMDLGDLRSAGADVILEAAADVAADLAHARRDLKVTAGNNMRIGQVDYGGQMSLEAGRNLWAKVGRDITFARAEVGGNAELFSGGRIAFDSLLAGGFISLDAQGDVDAGGAIEAGGSIRVHSGGNVTTGSMLSEDGRIDLDAAGDILVRGDLRAGDAISARAGGSIATGTVQSGSHIGLEADGDIAVGGSLQAEGMIAARAAGSVLAEAVASGATIEILAGRDADVKGAIDAADAISVSAGRDLRAASLAARGGTIGADAGRDIGIAGQASATGSVAFNAGGNLAAGAIASAASGIHVLAGGDATIGSASAALGTVSAVAGNLRVGGLTAVSANLDAAGQLGLGLARIGERLDLAGREIDASVVQVPAAGPLRMNLSGRGGSLAERATLDVGGASELAFGRLHGRQVALKTGSGRVSIGDAYVPGSLVMETPVAVLAAVNDSTAPRQGANVQLHEQDARFWLRQDGRHTDTSAYVLRYDRGYTVSVPNFVQPHTEGGPVVRGESALIYNERAGNAQRDMAGGEILGAPRAGLLDALRRLGAAGGEGLFSPRPLPLGTPAGPAVNIGIPGVPAAGLLPAGLRQGQGTWLISQAGTPVTREEREDR